MGIAGGIVPVGTLFLWIMPLLVLPLKVSGKVAAFAFAFAFFLPPLGKLGR